MKKIINKAKLSASKFEKQVRLNVIRLNKILSSRKANKDFAQAGVLLKTIKVSRSEAQEEIKLLLADLKETESAAKEFFQPLFSKIEDLDKNYKQQMLDHLEKLEEKTAKLNKDFSDNKIKSIKSYNGKLDSLSIAPTKGGASIRNSTKLVIEDVNLIPRQFMIPDEVAIRKALLEGVEIPGCKMKTVKSISV